MRNKIKSTSQYSSEFNFFIYPVVALSIAMRD